LTCCRVGLVTKLLGHTAVSPHDRDIFRGGEHNARRSKNTAGVSRRDGA
jgi:hypothetical protein